MTYWNEIVNQALKAYHCEYGENAPLPEGGKFAAVCERGVLVFAAVNGEIKCEIIEKIYHCGSLRAESSKKQPQPWFIDEIPQEDNEVIGVCYGKAILVTDSGAVMWFDAPQPEIIKIGDFQIDDGLFHPLSELPADERKKILAYLIEAGSTPEYYLDILKDLIYT